MSKAEREIDLPPRLKGYLARARPISKFPSLWLRHNRELFAKVAPPFPHKKPYRGYTSLLRFLFPHTRQRARARLWEFRHEYLPSLRQRAQSRIYRYIVQRQALKRSRKPRGILRLLRKRNPRGLLTGASLKKDDSIPAPNKVMRSSIYGTSGGDDSGGGSGGDLGSFRSEGREPGARRRKLAGYLKAANELRQSYQQSYTSGWGNKGANYDETGEDGPGGFPDAAVVRNGEEEMILFPSYASRHIKRKPQVDPSTIQEDSANGRDTDADFWKQQWEQYEDDNAIVDIDVRGWIYTPHSGQMTRKHRLFVSLARQLVGIQAPPATGSSPTDGGDSPTGGSLSPYSTHQQRHEARQARRDEDAISKEAESILRKGEQEAAIANKGGYSENPSHDDFSGQEAASEGDSSPNPSSRRGTPTSRVRHQSSNSPGPNGDREVSPLRKPPSWNQPADMSPAELAVANKHLMTRLKPFLANPVSNTPISIFFFNDEISRQRTVYTNPYGHFSVRAALDFIPTHVRVLASEKLSVTEKVIITEPRGISLISDIDDTIKHSAISSGAREIFRNAFIRELEDLTVEGVKDWYNRLYQSGVRFHYVSNSPWQIYPILTKFFSLAGLPPGSFHLKQYSGMFQGIFEPVAERKKGTLDKIANDFPERKFILVGDSGEADLEVYTDYVLENPGRVLAVFIRDVTTPIQKGFFDSSMGPLAGERASRPPNTNGNSSSTEKRQKMTALEEEDDPDLKAAIAASLRDMEEKQKNSYQSSNFDDGDAPQNRPTLPPRVSSETPPLPARRKEPSMGTLVDVSSDTSNSPQPPPKRFNSDSASTVGSRGDPENLTAVANKSAPPLPRKPVALRSSTGDSIESNSSKRPPPPKPRRPSTAVTNDNVQGQPSRPLAESPRPIDEQQGYMSSARQKLASVYNSLPPATSYWQNAQDKTSNDKSVSSGGSDDTKKLPPQPPPRRNITAYPAAAAQFATTRVNNLYAAAKANSSSSSLTQPFSSTANNNDQSTRNSFLPNPMARVTSTQDTSLTNSSSTTGQNQAVNKKEEIWRRRWARAQQILDEKGVVLRSWRVGTDVIEESIRLVEEEKKKNNQEWKGRR